MGRLKKIDIENSIGSIIKSKQIIICSDAHVNYKGFAIDNKIEHHAPKAVIKQHIKNKIYHIQHASSTHNRLKKWIDNTFWSVSTKYLQQYLNWYRVKEMLKNRNYNLKAFTQKVTEDITVYQKYKKIEFCYEKLIAILK